MGDLVELFSQPAFVVIATALLVILAGCAFFYFWRSSRARKAYAETAARERELRRQFEAVVASTRDGVMVVTSTQEVAMVSDVAARMLGLTRDDVIGKPVSRLPMKVFDVNMHPVPVADAFAPTTEAPRAIGVPGRRGEEDIRWLHVRSSVVEDGP